METVNPSSRQEDLLDDLDDMVVLNPATQGQRFGNYIIDRIVAYAFAFLIVVMVGVVIGLLGGNSDGVFEGLPLYLLMYISYVWYYTTMEALNKGRTIGKLITGTYAVTRKGNPITLKTAFYRSLCRIVPFEAFSGFGQVPWHDSWTDTTVVKK
ncbi:RDD family protein [Chitinophaga japonensis]|uniref:Putative RDD family membrane protein YckC n=1 Tax=Chitinophaga japonensis TaxID=104662 RepID=A0A562T542_CHIJA|nr:RDD family protein [Chitinophaga japonensis]TWI88176.1 putative RDD family membrane protein YckC [Chitinophaga japonensis]